MNDAEWTGLRKYFKLGLSKRLFLPLIIALLCLQACDSVNPTSATPTQPAIIIRDDLALLRTRITLPPTVTGARWTVLPLGTAYSDVPGPTDTILYAYLTSSDGQLLSFGVQPKQGVLQQSITLPTDVAQAIIPASELGTALKKPGSYHLQGPAYDPAYFDAGSYRGQAAILVGKGLLVILQSQ